MTQAKFWDDVADKYVAGPIKDVDAYETKLAMTQHYLRPDHRIFEFGCGSGGTARIHAAHVSEVVATDISPRMIEFAQAKAEEEGVGNIRFEAVSIEDYADEAPFDMVLGLSILHLLGDRKVALSKASELLKPGGYFVHSTPNLGQTHGWLRFVIPIMKAFGKAPDVYFFTEADLIADIEAVGFEIVERFQPGKSAATFMICRKASD